MLQKQMPIWVSHYPPDSCQEDGDRPAATCALEVRAKGWVGGPGAEGRRHTQRGLGSRRLQTHGAPWLGQPLLGTGDTVWPSFRYPQT